MPLTEQRHGVWLDDYRVGTLNQRGDHTLFTFTEDYLPDRVYADVPRNEHAMMSLAAAVGIDIPEIKLVHRDKLDNLPSGVWPPGEDWAYAIRRFDRDENRKLVHIEDLAQVRNVYPDRKYSSNFETVAALIYRRRDLTALREFARRLTFIILISNGDAHYKNWSLIYPNRRIPTLSPAYDLVCTAVYRADDEPEDLGLKFGGTRRFTRVSTHTFTRLEERLQVRGAQLADIVAETVDKTRAGWPQCAALLDGNQRLQDAVHQSIETHSRTLLRRAP